MAANIKLQELIKKHLPQHIWTEAMGFVIPEAYIADTPDLITLIIESRAIETKEDKQNWFNLLPLMNVDQINKLRLILEKEKKKLLEIEAKYEKKKLDIKKKYLAKWQELWRVKKIDQLHETEAAEAEADEKAAEDLLHNL